MPSIAIVRPYEAVYIVDPDLGEEQVSAITDRYRTLVEGAGGTVQNVDVWERRKLAYEIKGHREGIYVIMHFSGTPSVETELRRVFQISEDQIRYIIVKLEDVPDAAEASAEPVAAAETVTPVVETAPVAETVPVAEAASPETEPVPDTTETAAPDAEPAAA